MCLILSSVEVRCGKLYRIYQNFCLLMLHYFELFYSKKSNYKFGIFSKEFKISFKCCAEELNLY